MRADIIKGRANFRNACITAFTEERKKITELGRKNPLISERMLAAHRSKKKRTERIVQHLMRKSVKFSPFYVLTCEWNGHKMLPFFRL